jgi:hypothetical protein
MGPGSSIISQSWVADILLSLLVCGRHRGDRCGIRPPFDDRDFTKGSARSGYQTADCSACRRIWRGLFSDRPRKSSGSSLPSRKRCANNSMRMEYLYSHLRFDLLTYLSEMVLQFPQLGRLPDLRRRLLRGLNYSVQVPPKSSINAWASNGFFGR